MSSEEVERVERGGGDRVGGEAAEEHRAAEARGRVGGEGQRGEQRVDGGGGDRGVAQGVVQDQGRVRRRQPRHLLAGSAGGASRGFDSRWGGGERERSGN